MGRKDNILDTDQLRAKLAKWQKILRLQDWDIRISVKRQKDMNLKDCSGEIDWVLGNKQAAITLVDPIDYPEDTPFEYDMEKTLVHEMLHLHLSPIGEAQTEEMRYNMLEQAIESITPGIVKLEKGKL